MRVAILSDIHGNAVALDACLADLAATGGADRIVAAGDLCMDGPRPRKVLRRLKDAGAHVVRGNTDRMIALISSLPKTIALLMIEHDMKVVFGIADRITVLSFGEVLASGSVAEIQANDRVREVYLGVAH